MEIKNKDIEQIIAQFCFKDYQWIDLKHIVFSHWVRMKCLYGCDEYSRPACPPNVPPIPECRDFIQEYKTILIFRFVKETDYHNYPQNWARQMTKKLLDLEKKIFLSGYVKVFLLNAFSCNLCKECTVEKTMCKKPKLLRPTPEALGIDVF